MTSQGRGKQSKASEVGANSIHSHPEDASANHTPGFEEIRLGAYEIYLERAGLPGDELDDWLQAEHELDSRATEKERAL